jgi:hypothetical protein
MLPFVLLLDFFFTSIMGNVVAEMPVYLALYQQNIDVLQDRLTDISNPASINYGKWMNPDEINKLVYPPVFHQTSVLDWINGYDVRQVKNYGDNVKFIAKPSVVIDMFNLTNDGEQSFTGYNIPVHLENIIEFVEMTSKPISRGSKPNRTSLDNRTDDRYFGREPLMALYNVPSYNLQQNVSVALIEYQSNTGFTNEDLNRQQIVNEQAINNMTVVVGNNIGIDIESELDVQLVSQAADGTRLWFWDTPYWLYSFAVDFYNAEDIPDIISMSWGWAQDSQCDIIDCVNITSKQYVDRVNTEYLKMVLRGTTIVASSGDAGAPGRTNQQCGRSRPINPIFPGSSPYVVSVGATTVQIDNTTRNYTSPLCLRDGCITSDNEISIRYDNVGWTAGGGFDIYHNETPVWQRKDVHHYLDSGVVLPNTSNFNKNGRAYPDISAIGHSCPTFIGGELQAIDGTSCSAPVVAGLLAIISDFIWTHHHRKLGFANPLLYHIFNHCPECFRDITDGYNWCTEGGCCDNATEYGFKAINGYDPVTGLGTLNVGKILNFLTSHFQKN